MWGRSRFVDDWYNGANGMGVRWSLFSLPGQLIYYRGWEINSQSPPFLTWNSGPSGTHAWGRRDTTWGFLWDEDATAGGRGSMYSRMLIIAVPYWSIALVSAVLPAIAVRRWVQARRHRRVGVCSACGYDLRATPDRCPECGKEVFAEEAR